MKFAVDRSLEGRRYETDPIGPSLQRVLRYWTVRNKFEEASIHPDLKKIGVARIKIEKEGLVFERVNTFFLILGLIGKDNFISLILTLLLLLVPMYLLIFYTNK